MNIHRLRAALHQCIDLIVDAIEAEPSEAGAKVTKPRRVRARPPWVDPGIEVPPEVAEKARFHARKNGAI